jgi:hypothetical protein
MLVCESHSSYLGSVCGLFLTSSMTFLSIFKIVSTSLFYETTCFDQNSRVSPVCYFFFLPFSFSSSLSRLHFTSLYFSCLSCFSFVASYVCHFDKSIYVDPNKYACFFFPTIIIILLNLFLFIEIAFPLITSMYNLSSYKLGLK